MTENIEDILKSVGYNVKKVPCGKYWMSSDDAGMSLEYITIAYEDDDNINGLLDKIYSQLLEDHSKIDEWDLIERDKLENWEIYKVFSRVKEERLNNLLFPEFYI